MALPGSEEKQWLPRDTSAWVCEHATHVTLDRAAIDSAAERIAGDLDAILQQGGFDKELHFFDGGALTAQYLLVVDSLNFCFWPDGELEYEHLARGLKESVLRDPLCISAERLAAIDGPGVRRLLGWRRDLPQQEERARLLREVGRGLARHFGGEASQLVAAAQGSAAALAELLAAHFPGFRDACVYKGRQVFFYKRAQIFAADLWGAFGGQGLGAFRDARALTMFADYRVPVVLRLMGCLRYSDALAAAVDGKQELPPGSEEEVEIRAASITAVELLRDAANEVLRRAREHNGWPAGRGGGVGQPPPQQLISVQLDWWLWAEGERMRARHPPHHRTLTVFY